MNIQWSIRLLSAGWFQEARVSVGVSEPPVDLPPDPERYSVPAVQRDPHGQPPQLPGQEAVEGEA